MKIILASLILILFGFTGACEDTISDSINGNPVDSIPPVDTLLPKARGLAGDYHGLLIVTRIVDNAPITDTDRVEVVLRLNDPDDPTVGTYSHRFDTLNADPSDSADFCNMPRGEWSIKNLKLILAAGNPSVDSLCDETLVPNSLIADVGGSVIVIPFTFATMDTDPLDEELGDSLILRQRKLAAGISTEFRLTLTSIPR